MYISGVAEQIRSVPRNPTKQISIKHKYSKDKQNHIPAGQANLNVFPTNEKKSAVLRRYCASITAFIYIIVKVLVRFTTTTIRSRNTDTATV